MKKILFVCLGNICRSPMAEFLMKDMVKQRGIEKEFLIESAGTSNEEEGNPVHIGTKNKLKEFGISTEGKFARQMNKEDYQTYDYIVAMETRNIDGILNIIKKDYYHKIYRLLDFSLNPRDIRDPWYTGNFEDKYQDIKEGIEYFLKYLGY